MADLQWRKSSFSANTNGDCVEVAPLPDGRIALRDSKHPDAGHIAFTRAGMRAWIADVKAGELDDPA